MKQNYKRDSETLKLEINCLFWSQLKFNELSNRYSLKRLRKSPDKGSKTPYRGFKSFAYLYLSPLLSHPDEIGKGI